MCKLTFHQNVRKVQPRVVEGAIITHRKRFENNKRFYDVFVRALSRVIINSKQFIEFTKTCLILKPFQKVSFKKSQMRLFRSHPITFAHTARIARLSMTFGLNGAQKPFQAAPSCKQDPESPSLLPAYFLRHSRLFQPLRARALYVL